MTIKVNGAFSGITLSSDKSSKEEQKTLKYCEINNMFEALVNSEHFVVYG